MEIEINDIEQRKIERKETWLDENSGKATMLSSNIIPLHPLFGYYIKVDNIDIPEEVFEEEFNAIKTAYFSVINKMENHYKNKMRDKKIDLTSVNEYFSNYDKK